MTCSLPSFTGLFPCIMNHAVQYAPVLIQVRDNQRLLPLLPVVLPV